MRRERFILGLAAGLLMLNSAAADGEDGYGLWLRYRPLAEQTSLSGEIVVDGDSPALEVAAAELERALPAMLRVRTRRTDAPTGDGAIVISARLDSALIAPFKLGGRSRELAEEGFVLRSGEVKGCKVMAIASASPHGAMYGTFELLRRLQTGLSIDRLDEASAPKLQRRLLDHWDNLDGSIERGYAGKSLWRWEQLPDNLDPRYHDYARACASIGINGTVLNNVNAKAQSLSAEYLGKTRALADVFRPYGIRVYLSANFAAPKNLGGLPTADPLDERVAQWWRQKADEIFQQIPDFGGFVVKANSEGQPGPQDYRRTHADGANVLADALAPHGGIVMWRAFVYDDRVDPDRAKRASLEFTALDGKFRPNVVVQVKNGPVDFMPREPFHPLLGAMKKTPVMAELQVTQEYLGHSNHLVFLGPMWKEFLDADTFARGPGSTVAKVIEGNVHPQAITAIAAVANTGSDRNWCGHHFAQANWYAYGRLAWNPNLSAQEIADEWLRMTFGPRDEKTLEALRAIMMSSWQTYISYTMPLGLHHLIGGDHYAPQPWNATEPRADWTATYYHQADERGIGFDRTRSGSNAVAQYSPPLHEQLENIQTCPENLLLWFHHVPWDHTMRSGRTLWEELCWQYDSGYEAAAATGAKWKTLDAEIDPQRHREVAQRLDIQVADARRWRDQCVSYFARFSKQPIPRWRVALQDEAPAGR